MSENYFQIFEVGKNVRKNHLVKVKNVGKSTKKCENVRICFGIKIIIKILFRVDTLISMSCSKFSNFPDILVYLHHGNF